jgi:DNA-binding PadR family transcriptional regulator
MAHKRASTTGHVILGVLATTGPASGYEIRQFIRQSVSYFWSESFGQIYPELKVLLAAGHVAPVRDAGGQSRRRRRFRITPAGRRALRAWLETPAQPEHVRVEFLVKLFFGHDAPPNANRAHIETIATRQRERLALLDRLGAAPALAASADAPQLVYWLLALRHGLVISRARLRWAEEARQLLDAADRGGNPAVLTAWRALMKMKTETTATEDV